MNFLSYKLHLFDLDDTLINTKQAYYSSYINQVIKFTRLDEDQAVQYLTELLTVYGSYNYQAIFNSLFKLLDVNLEKQDIDKVSSSFSEDFWSNLKVNNKAIEYLKHLIHANCYLGLVSNGRAEIQEFKLKKLGLDVFFKEGWRMISSATQKPKPDNWMLLNLVQYSNCSVENSVFYGNALVDLLAAKNCNMTFVLYKNEPTFFNDNDISFLDSPYVIKNWSILL